MVVVVAVVVVVVVVVVWYLDGMSVNCAFLSTLFYI